MTDPRNWKMNKDHVLYRDNDPDAPDCIKDIHGAVVLDLCRRCGKGEIELDGPCERRTEDGSN